MTPLDLLWFVGLWFACAWFLGWLNDAYRRPPGPPYGAPRPGDEEITDADVAEWWARAGR